MTMLDDKKLEPSFKQKWACQKAKASMQGSSRRSHRDDNHSD